MLGKGSNVKCSCGGGCCSWERELSRSRATDRNTKVQGGYQSPGLLPPGPVFSVPQWPGVNGRPCQTHQLGGYSHVELCTQVHRELQMGWALG